MRKPKRFLLRWRETGTLSTSLQADKHSGDEVRPRAATIQLAALRGHFWTRLCI